MRAGRRRVSRILAAVAGGQFEQQDPDQMEPWRIYLNRKSERNEEDDKTKNV